MAVVGAGTKFQIGKEATYGVPVAATFPINFTSESIALKVDKKAEENLMASKAAMASDLVNMTVDGSFGFVLRPEFAGQLFKMALGGTDTVTTNFGSVSGYNEHKIILADANGSFPSYTLIVDRKVSVKKYSGCKVDSLDLECKAGDYVRGTVNIKGKDESSGATTGGLSLTNKSFKTVGATFTFAGTNYDINTATVKISNNQQSRDQTYGSGLYFPEPLHGLREIAIDFEIPYDASIDTLKDNYLITETLGTSAELTLLSPSVVTGSSQYKVIVTLNNVSITDVSYNVGDSGIIKAKISGKALSIGAAEPLIVKVYDGNTTAY